MVGLALAEHKRDGPDEAIDLELRKLQLLGYSTHTGQWGI